MKTRRLATTGVALAAALGLGLTGCGTRTDAPAGNWAAPASNAPVDARAELTTAAQQLSEQSSRVVMTSPILKGSGVLDPVARKMDITLEMGSDNKFRMITLGDDSYLRMGSRDTWLHLDSRKVGDGSQLKAMANGDPGGVNELLKHVVEVKRAEGGFAGTLDYGRGAASAEAAALGDKAKAVPFTARTDAEGRLTELVVDMDAIVPGMGKMTSTYSDFGRTVTVKKPPANQVEEAPAEVLAAFGG